MALIVFAVTLFMSAFLLFLVQPMIGKMILPMLGGTPQVWNTCMLFFQTVLLAGYFYTHATTNYLRPRKQMLLHGALLFLPLIAMVIMAVAHGQPFYVRDFQPPTDGNPIFATLMLLLAVVGIPFFVVSTSAPLLQKWFSFSGDPAAADPYFLYGASNLGSMLSLAFYPFIVEPFMAVGAQTWLWFTGYVILAAMILFAAAKVWRNADQPPAELSPEGKEHIAPNPLPAETVPTTTTTAIQPSKALGKKKGLKGGGPVAASVPTAASAPKRVRSYDAQAAPLTIWRCIRWVLLAAVPSSLMLGVTSYVSTDLSPFPLVWAIPLGAYLLTFILVFAKWPIVWTEEPHNLMLYATPLFAVPALCMVIFTRSYAPTGWPMFFSFVSIFIITLTLHGELARDRPAAKHLTLFFLLMSFGGMLGGLFNGLFAPVIFTNIVEYPIAIILACFLQPNLLDHGYTDGLILDSLPDVKQSMAEASDNFAKGVGIKPEGKPFLFSYFWDIVVGLFIVVISWYCINYRDDMGNRVIGLFRFLGMKKDELDISYRSQGAIYLLAGSGLALLLCVIVATRSLRYALGIAGVLTFGYIMTDRQGQIYAGRSYFGVLKVLFEMERVRALVDTDQGEKVIDLFVEAKQLPPTVAAVKFNYLMHGSTYHGRNYQDDGLTRLATTYYHRFGPVGCVMERFNWFPGEQNTYYADNRMPATMVGLSASLVGISNLPLEALCNCWSETPFATVGLGTGTMASYGRPLQHVAYYEIDELIRLMSRPKNDADPYFRYVKEAGERGSEVEIIMGDARLSLEREVERTKVWETQPVDKRGPTPMRDGYYSVIVLDAFSSDAIPVHLITKKAVELYMQKLRPDGILCVHTSNRHLKLTDPVADIATELKLDYVIGQDNGGDRNRTGPRKDDRVYSLGHFASQYIMLARKDVKRANGKSILDRGELVIRGIPGKTSIVTWQKDPPPNRAIWTDDYQNIISILGRH